MGYDDDDGDDSFDGVHVHHGGPPALGAQAYTEGADIAFGDGGYDAADGGGLLAHELTHVVQQAAWDAGDDAVDDADDGG
jgi:uncharacterized protein DUF4157